MAQALLVLLFSLVVSAVEHTWVITRASHRPDGYLQPVVLINGLFPGPPLLLEKGEEVVIHVVNKMDQQAITMHWHGLLQRGTSWHDGTRGINQCPIAPNGGAFTYRFTAEDAGTSWYHSHVDFQIENGAAGVIVIRDPDDEYNVPREREVPILLLDWHHGNPLDGWLDFKVLRPDLTYPSSYEQPVASQVHTFPESLMFNGKANYDCRPALESYHNCTWTATDNSPHFEFNKNEEYRLRFINGGGVSTSPMDICIGPGNIRLTVIAADGEPIMPLRGNCFQMTAGQRIDALWRAKLPFRSGGLYLRVRTIMPGDRPRLTGYAQMNVVDDRGESVPGSCRNHCDDNFLGTTGCSCRQTCLRTGDCCVDYTQWCASLPLLYDEGEDDGFLDINREGIFLNEIDYRARHPANLEPEPDNNYVFQTTTTSGVADFNATSLTLDRPDPLQLQWYHGRTEFPPSVLWMQTDTTVDWLFTNEHGLVHPMHFHGHRFHVLGSEYGSEGKVAMFDKRTAKLNYYDPPMRDTFDMPSHGWVLVRWVANNPGMWIFHCHIETHMMMGMAFVVGIGQPDPEHPGQMRASDLNAPPRDFPTCSNPSDTCPVGGQGCPCTAGKGCDRGLRCQPRWEDTSNAFNTVCKGPNGESTPITSANTIASSSTSSTSSASSSSSSSSTSSASSLSYVSERVVCSRVVASARMTGSIQRCSRDSDCRDDGLYCATLGLCVPYRGLCEACNAVQQCRPGLRCGDVGCEPEY